ASCSATRFSWFAHVCAAYQKGVAYAVLCSVSEFNPTLLISNAFPATFARIFMFDHPARFCRQTKLRPATHSRLFNYVLEPKNLGSPVKLHPQVARKLSSPLNTRGAFYALAFCASLTVRRERA